MLGSMIPAPDIVAATNDSGDDTASRYRYQWTYAAITCCMLLDDTCDAIEVFCEYYEDVLIKHTDGTLSGLQVKTRASDQPAWTTRDSGLSSSCVRFAELELRSPGQFRAFRFLTNHPLHAGGNGQDIRYVLRTIRTTASASDLPRAVATFLDHVARGVGCSAEVAITALSKTDAIDDLPKLPDIEARLVDTLTAVWPRAAECSHASVVRVARSIATECGRASSLAHQNVLPAYLPATSNPETAELAARLKGKRIDRLRLLELLERGLNEAAPLDGNPESCIEPGAGKRDLLLRKLDAGGFSAVSCNSASDLRDKADYLGIVWTKKHGRELGLQRYGHVLSLVLSDAARAFETSRNDKHPFGVNMLSELRSRFQQRRKEGSQLYDCSDEHLEGFAFSLTAQCKVQWSLDGTWEAQ